jgi:hypothetical protein
MIISRRIAYLIILLLEKDAQHWEKLLYTSGGKLEIPKCCFAIFQWLFDDIGRAKLQDTIKYHLHIKSSDNGKLMTIPQMSTGDAYKYLGVHIALDGYMTRQIEPSVNKCQQP